MSFTENLKVEIESVFDSKGFKQLEAQLGRTMAKFKGMEKMMNRARGMRNLTSEAQSMQNVLDEAGLNFQGINKDIDELSGQQIGGMVSQFGDKSQLAKQQWREIGGFIKDAEGNLVNIGPAIERIAGAQSRLENLSMPFEDRQISTPLETMKMEGFDAGQFQMPDIRSAGIGVAASELGVLGAEAGQVHEATGGANGAFQRFTGRVKGAAGQISADMIPSLQSLQMTLLGVQFQLLSLAFIFGGLMGSALGAVGIFKILGNTLKMFFLPIALELLPLVLDIRDAILGVDEETRKTIGRIFAIIAAISALGSIIAFVVNGFLAFLTPLKILSPLISKLVPAISQAGGVMSTLGAIASSVAGAFTKFFALMAKIIPGLNKVILGTASTIMAFFAGLAGAFLAVVTVAKRFGKKIALAFGLVLAAIGAVVAAIASAPLVIAAAIGVIIGAILGLLWTFKDTVIGIFMAIVNFAVGAWMTMFKGIVNIIKGLVNIIQGLVSAIVAIFLGEWDRAFKYLKEAFNGFVQFLWGIVQLVLAPFIEIYKRLVGNSIIPDMIKEMISWLFKLPGAAFDAATGIVNQIIKGIKGIGSGIWDAFKSVLPDFIVDALEGTGQAIASGVNAVAGFAQSGVNAVSNFASNAGDFVSGINPFGGNGGGNKTEVQQNNINAQVEVNDKEETPQETGRQLGQGLSQSLNSRQSDIASGT